MDIRKIRRLVDLLNESGISEIEIREGEESVRISRNAQTAAPAAPPAHYVAPAPPAQTTEPGASPEPKLEPSSTEIDGHAVRSPMVGTYYASPAPGEPPFVEEGQRVTPGDVLCVIEAMKMLNQIECDVEGVVRRVLVDNGQPVEYDQPLFMID